MHDIQIKQVTYNSSVPGKTLMITGVVHGDEHCGAKALNRLIDALDSGEIRLKSGKLIIVPICNPKAYEANTRFIDRNLNRYLFPKENPKDYEDFIDPILCDLLRQTDVLLDLHSYASPGGPFIFISTNKQEETDFARDLGIKDFVCGWSEAYGGNKREDGDKEGMGTTEYARAEGALAAVTLECGQHLNEDAPDIGYEASLRAMSHLGLLEPSSSSSDEEKSQQRLVRMRDVFYRQEGAVLSKEYRHFDYVAKGDVVASDADGNALYTANFDGYVVLPKHKAPVGSEWFYFGEADKFSDDASLKEAVGS